MLWGRKVVSQVSLYDRERKNEIDKKLWNDWLPSQADIYKIQVECNCGHNGQLLLYPGCWEYRCPLPSALQVCKEGGNWLGPVAANI